MADNVEDKVPEIAPEKAIEAEPVDFNFGFDQTSLSKPDGEEAEAAEALKIIIIDDEATKEDSLEVELSEEALRQLELEKKKKRREEKRQKDEAMKKKFAEPSEQFEAERKSELEQKAELEQKSDQEPKSDLELEPETESEPEPEPQPKDKRRTTTDSAFAKLGSLLSGDRGERMSQKSGGDYDDEIGGQLSSSSDGEDYSRRACSVSFKGEFFNNFYFPSMSDISSDSEAEDALQSLRSTMDSRRDVASVRDEGTFVDPLTGEAIPDKQPEQQQKPVKPAEVPKPAAEESDEEEESSTSELSFDWPFGDDDIVAPVVEQKEDPADAAMDFLLETRSTVHLVDVESTTKLEMARAARETRQIVIDFVFKLIDEAVETAEYFDPLVAMCLKMDKHKLLKDLHRLMHECKSAKEYNTVLMNKMFDYYRRLGQMRVFERLPPEQERVERNRQREALKHLDFFKKKAVETKRLNNLQMASVTMDLEYTRNMTICTVETLEKSIRDTLIRKDMTILPRIVDLELRRMQNMRNEISDSRLWLITRQHTLGRLIERKRNFDQITEELTMDQFLNAQREVASLDTKVDERHHDLKRMHDRCTKHVHQLAFIREKTSMITENLIKSKYELAQKMKRQSKLRDQVLKLKVQHARLKEQKHELQRQSGLLYKPALLQDFDETVDFINAKKKRVKKQKRILHDIEARIAMYENMIRSSITPISTPRKSLTTGKVT